MDRENAGGVRGRCQGRDPMVMIGANQLLFPTFSDVDGM